MFEKKIKPLLTYIGACGAVITSVAYMIMVVVLIKGFQYQQTTQTIVFALANAAVGMVIASMLRYQGISFAKNLEENQAVIKRYYELHTKDKRNYSLKTFWVKNTIKDIVVKGLSVAASTLGLIYIVIVGSNDWALLGIAVVNLLLFICFGLLALNQAYDYYNNIYVNYMWEQINNVENNKKTPLGKKKNNGLVCVKSSEPNKDTAPATERQTNNNKVSNSCSSDVERSMGSHNTGNNIS